MRFQRALTVVVTAALFGVPQSAIAFSHRDAEKYIRDSEAAWVASEAAGDPSVAQRILADDYVGVFSDGTISNKANAVSEFSPTNHSLTGRLDYVNVRFFGRTAIAQGKETDTWPAGSSIPNGSLIFTDVFVLRHGRWQLVNSEDQFQPTTK